MQVSILRIGHRLVRDDRITTHAALVARAFGCNKIYMTEVDNSIKTTIDQMNRRWGKACEDFNIEIINNWKYILKNWKQENENGLIIHLTMYGMNVDEIIEEIKSSSGKILVVIGAEKVPRDVYNLSDYNVAIGNQPHSEIAALSIFLDRVFSGKQLVIEFKSGKYRIIPSNKNKIVKKVL